MNVTRLRWWCAVKTSQNWNLRCGAQTDEINPAIKTCPTVDLSLITSGGEIWRESGPFSHDDWLVVMTMFAPDLAPLTLSPGNALDNFLNLTDELTWHRPGLSTTKIETEARPSIFYLFLLLNQSKRFQVIKIKIQNIILISSPPSTNVTLVMSKHFITVTP